MTYDTGYPNEPIGDGNPYYRCVHCKVSDPEINGDISKHQRWCEYRQSKESSPPVAVQEEGDAWQPIEMAPKDGKEFLAIWGRQGNLMQVVRWNTVHKLYQSKGEPILGFSSNATAWQPLPPPPRGMKGDRP